jgi:CHRD domain-containing protein
MKRLLILGAAFLLVSGCGSKTPTSPSNANQVRFTAALLPSNEVPPITNAEASGNGLATITLNLTRDAGGAITAANADFLITMNGFPANTTVTAAHIHPAPAGQNGSALISLGLSPGEFVLVNGLLTFTRTGITSNLDAARAQDIINNPANYYFNIHSTLNGGGFARGQLVKQ